MFINKQTKGFTLIELMIAVAIVGILAAIAVPSYQESMRKSRRADAQGALMNFANGMERHFTEANTYCDAAGDATETEAGESCGAAGEFDEGEPLASVFSPTGKTIDFYTFRIQDVTMNSFTIRASPIPGGAQQSDGFLLLTSTGIRQWDRNDNGVIESPGEDNWE